jgi:hypothetical protein
VFVLPTLVLIYGNLDSIAKFAFGDLDCSSFALFVDAASTVVGGGL